MLAYVNYANNITVVANDDDIDLREVKETMNMFDNSLLQRCPFHDSLVFSTFMFVQK